MQGRGRAWPLTRGTAGGWARRHNRAAPAPRPALASLPAAPCPGRRARQALRPCPLPTRGRGRAVPRAPGLNFPLASLPSHVLHGRVVRGLVSGSHPETSAKLGSQDAWPASESGLDPCPSRGHPVNAPSGSRPSPGSQPPSLPAFQGVRNCISGVEKPGPRFLEADA